MTKPNILDRTNKSAPRSDLVSLIPLRSPFVVMIDPSSACNLKCKFCPTGDPLIIKASGRWQGFMRPELFQKIISDLDLFPDPIKTLRLYKEGDPLVNPFFPELVEIARNGKNVRFIDTTTNGLLLKNNLSDKIIASGIDQINISINGLTSEQYKFYTKREINFERLVDEIAYLYSIRGKCEIYVKCISEHLTDAEKEKFFEIFGGISDRIFLEHLQPNWPDFSFDYIQADYKVGHYGQPAKDKDVCPYIFYMMVINSDGTVSACVQDWGHKLIVGDCRIESVKDIWDGAKLHSLRLTHLRRKRCDLGVCKSCPVLKYGALDNIDHGAELLLEKLVTEKYE